MLVEAGVSVFIGMCKGPYMYRNLRVLVCKQVCIQVCVSVGVYLGIFVFV